MANRAARVIVAVCAIIIAGSIELIAQGSFEYQPVTAALFETYNPQVAIDHWGNTHLMWSSRDPRRSGLQLFYSHNGSGRFSAPIQVTDTGTVFDSTNISFSSFAFKLDALGIVHVAFVANVENHLRLYYTNNAKGRFADAVFLAERSRFGMAVDSLGNAHIVWAEDATNGFNLHYWSSIEPDASFSIGTLPCAPFRYGCSVGEVEIESGVRGLQVAVSADSGSIYHMQMPLGAFRRVQMPGYDQIETMMGRADLRFRMALDAEGAVHVLVPRVTPQGRHRLVYAHNANGAFTHTVLVDSLAAKPSGFDLTFNAADRFVALWSAEPPDAPGMAGMLEITRPARAWVAQQQVRDINGKLSAPASTVWKRAMRVAAAGERVVITGLARPDVSREEIVTVITRTGLRPQLSYLHPDAAAPGMNVVVEAVAPAQEKGSFGRDGFRGDTVTLQLRNSFDTSRVVIGPSVVSWNGRLVSTMIFVKPGAAPGPVPVRVVIGGAASNTDTFFIVAPQHIGDERGVLSGGGALGSGGVYGTRSRRGVLVVDSLHLTDGTYRIDTSDIDHTLPGNQGFLPTTILSLGPVRIDSGAVLDASAEHDRVNGRFGTAGPGGGGGGSGGWIAGGSGFAGGGGPGRYVEGPVGASMSSGVDVRSSRWGGGGSLNGVPGGLGYPHAPGGGATGHPFGASGAFGRTSATEPLTMDSGGYGGAGAGMQALRSDDPTTGGGGGSFGRTGLSGNAHSETSNGGAVVGSRPLVPLAGGAGGGGGGFSTNGIANGGGGGGALGLFSFGDVTVAGTIAADGAEGVSDTYTTNSSGGGGGSGGGVMIGAKGPLRFVGEGRVTAIGGRGGLGSPSGGRNGGDGGDGRIRIDGRAPGASARTLPLVSYSGPATLPNGSLVAREGAAVRGTGEPGRRINVFMRSESGRWNFGAPLQTVVGIDSVWSVKIPSAPVGGKVFIVAMQEVANASRGTFTSEPAWVMSVAGGNIVGQPSMAISRRDHEFGCIKYTDRDSTIIWVRNTGLLSDVEIRNVRIDGAGRSVFERDYAGERIAPGDSMPLHIRFAPRDTGTFKAVVTILTNIRPDSVVTISLEGCAIAGRLAVTGDTDLETICVGDTATIALSLTNIAQAPLIITGVRGTPGVLDVVSVDRTLPVTLRTWGETLELSARVVVRRFDPSGMSLFIDTDGETRTMELPVTARDGRPMPQHAGAVVFRTLNTTLADTCEQRSIWIVNASETESMTVVQAAVDPSGIFELVSSPVGRIVATGDSVEAIVRFCTPVAGDFAARLTLSFGEGMCRVESAVDLVGRATEGAARLSIEQPKDRIIQFRQTLVGSVAQADSVGIRNDGEVAGRVVRPTIELASGTLFDEFRILPSAGYPMLVESNGALRFDVEFAPKTAGPKRAMAYFTSEDGTWRDSVSIEGHGTVPGVVIDMSTINFRSHRVGSVSEPDTLVIYNNGTAPATIASLTPASGAFVLESMSHNLPVTIADRDTIRAVYRYAPVAERRDTLPVTVEIESQPPMQALLVGRGVLEHVVVVDTLLNLGSYRRNARVSIPEAFKVINTGSHDLRIDSVSFVQRRPLFTWLATPPQFPMIVAPGEAHSFALGFEALEDATSMLVIHTSANAPEHEARVHLNAVLFKEPDTVDVMMSLSMGRVGEHTTVPVMAAFSSPTAFATPYTITVSFAPGLLAARGATTGAQLPAAMLAGTMSSSARYDVVAPGRLTISGVVRGGSSSGRLINIPVIVLTGPPATTPLAFDTAMFPATPPYVVRRSAGTFVGIDCDTGRGIVAKGRYDLAQNVPNPVERRTLITYSVAAHERVLINLYDPSGLFVQTLLDEVKEPGTYQLYIDASSIGSGAYTYEMISGPYRKTQRMVVSE